MSAKKNISGLRPFKKGQSGNPKGRPRLPDLRAVMSEILGEEKEGMTALKAIIAKLRQLATQGNIKAAELLLSRGYGFPKQYVDHTTDGEKINPGFDLSKLNYEQLKILAGIKSADSKGRKD